MMKIWLVFGFLVVMGIILFFLFKKPVISQNPNPPSVVKKSQPKKLVNPKKELTFSLKPQKSSSESGSFTLSEFDQKVTAKLSMSNEPLGVSQPAFIQKGSCVSPGKISYLLTSVSGGSSVTVLNVSLNSLMSQLPLSVSVRKSPPDSGVVVSCGELKVR